MFDNYEQRQFWNRIEENVFMSMQTIVWSFENAFHSIFFFCFNPIMSTYLIKTISFFILLMCIRLFTIPVFNPANPLFYSTKIKEKEKEKKRTFAQNSHLVCVCFFLFNSENQEFLMLFNWEHYIVWMRFSNGILAMR